jgi:hypothetical protein
MLRILRLVNIFFTNVGTPKCRDLSGYRADGDAGLVHRLRGRPKALRRKAPELRAGGLARYDERYGDFGPTLAAEYLALDDTFKKAPESKKKQGRQTELGV